MIKFVDAKADKKTGISRVWLREGKKEFLGIAYLAEGDDWSHIFGCRIAELRATIKAINDMIETKRNEYKVIENFIKAVSCYKNFDPNSETTKCMYRQLNRKKIEINRLIANKKIIKQFIKDSIKAREEFKTKIKHWPNSGTSYQTLVVNDQFS